MAETTDLGEIVWQCRENITRNFESNPQAATLVAYDAVTTLLLAAVEELRGIREHLSQRSGDNA